MSLLKPATARHDLHKSAVVPGGERTGCAPDQRHRDRRGDGCRSDGSYISHLELYLRGMADVGASTRQFDRFRSLARVGVSVETAMARSGVPPHVKAFVARTMAVADSGSTEEVLAELFYDREDIIPDMFRRLQTTLHDARRDSDSLRHFSYYIDRHIEVRWGQSRSKGAVLLEDCVADLATE